MLNENLWLAYNCFIIFLSCMSVPITMRTILKKAQEVEVSENMEKHCANGNVSPPFCSGYKREAVIEQHSIPQDTQSNLEKDIPNTVYDHNEDMFPDENGGVHSVDLHEPSPCPTQELNSNYTEDPYFHPVEIDSSRIDERNSSVAEDSYSSLAEEPSSSIVQELSPIMAEVPSPNVAEDPSSSITGERSSSIAGELSSSIAEELGLSVSGLVMPQSIPEHEMDECY